MPEREPKREQHIERYGALFFVIKNVRKRLEKNKKGLDKPMQKCGEALKYNEFGGFADEELPEHCQKTTDPYPA